jgi:8-amino-7-oxononanoate synthase
LRVRTLSEYFLSGLRSLLRGVPAKVLSLPPHLADQTAFEHPPTIIPLLTPYARPLRAYFLSRGMTTQDVNFPVVPKDSDRIRVCLHATNTHEDIDRLLQACSQWISRLMTLTEVEGLEDLRALVGAPKPKVVARL